MHFLLVKSKCHKNLLITNKNQRIRFYGLYYLTLSPIFAAIKK